ncbi:hypothetical protein NSA47_14740 [Irregularibacter muris]|uniref:Uncharacterized protein n=1 Tax=Irregularibacter muris TaxID=1796619 RepID=A0AAE3HGK6_9FIRM|nr:hypothetical protein [Irregularibacter muris]MCR1900222.1 hypothetical protein [Irregularibacter muris]
MGIVSSLCGLVYSQEGIINISHLEKKIIDKSAYDELWMKRCEEMQKKLETKRRK